MAAPLKGPLHVLHSSLRLCGVRCMSRRIQDDGPKPWAARQLPSGKTFPAIKLTRIQNRELWKKRMKYVNEPWQQTLFKYNQRKAEMEDAPKPSPPELLMVRLVRGTGGRPYWEKDIVKEFDLTEIGKYVIVKNKQAFCEKLKIVKHLVEIKPVTFPYGLPESEDDYEHCYIRDNGEFVVTKRLDPASEQQPAIATSTEQSNNIWDIKQELIDKTVERKKQLYQIHQEYYPTQYVWKRNEDGKEYRYKGNFNIGSDKIWY